jgi:hypothetical protein
MLVCVAYSIATIGVSQGNRVTSEGKPVENEYVHYRLLRAGREKIEENLNTLWKTYRLTVMCILIGQLPKKEKVRDGTTAFAHQDWS